jgi:hypothetical protein
MYACINSFIAAAAAEIAAARFVAASAGFVALLGCLPFC